VPRPLTRRVDRLKARRPAPCGVCGGGGRVAVVYASRGESAQGRPGCPGCGAVLAIEVHEVPVEAWHGRKAG
jgi:hypothetical protein